jgi:ankyrin repeat protein
MDVKRLFRNIVVSGCLLGHFLSAKADDSAEESVSDEADRMEKDSHAYKAECKRFIKRLDRKYLEGRIHTGKESNQVVLGDTLLCHVARRGRFSAAKLLLEKGANPDATGFELLDENVVMRILSDHKIDIHSSTPLCEAVRKGHYEITELLLQHGADPNKENDCFSPLGLAAHFYCKKDEKIGLKLMKLLLDNGADPNRYGFCLPSLIAHPLHIVSSSGNDPKAILMLLNAGANIKEKDINGNTPLHDAAKPGNYDIMKILIEQGADINALNESHQTPLDLLIARKNQLKRATNRWPYDRNRSVEFNMKWRYERGFELLREHGATIGSVIETEDSEIDRILRARQV